MVLIFCQMMFICLNNKSLYIIPICDYVSDKLVGAPDIVIKQKVANELKNQIEYSERELWMFPANTLILNNEKE